jgi:mannose-6-phosphate isomerase-like protein (cupin superfamily)
MDPAAWQSGGECDPLPRMAKKTSRRNFLRTAPVAAAVGLTLADKLMFAAQAGASPGADVVAAAAPFKLFSAKELDADMKTLDAKPGDNRLYESTAIPVQIILTTERSKSAKEFEWHEGRDHVVQIIEGSTLYEVGGTPKGGHVNKGPGEWLAPGSDGSKSILMGKGDMLLIPRGTLHKRSTEDSVTFMLISNPAPANV